MGAKDGVVQHLQLFDNQSIAFLLMPGWIAALLSQLVNWRINSDFPGVKWWSIGLACQAVGVVIRAGVPIEHDTLAIIVVNALVMGGQFVLLYGLCLFTGRRMFFKTAVVIVAADIAGQVYFSVTVDWLFARTILFALTLTVACGLQFALLPRLARREGWIGVIVLMVAYGMTLLGVYLRAIAVAINGADAVGALQVGENIALDGRQAITAIVATALTTSYSYGYILLVSSRSRWRMRQMATADPLTGAPNRRAFDAEVAGASLRARRNHTRLGLAIFDLDHFKQVNDTYGHAVGDQVLRHFVGVVHETLRETDFFARVGGEEFALLLDDANTDMIQQAAERIRQAVERSSLVLPEGVIRITVSAGMAVGEPGEGDMDTLYHEADMALYRAKANGRNRIERSELIAHVPNVAGFHH
jgi:diguanylate cyclase (GGDEF)-like protein